jgi:hypothetical protein
MQAAWAVLTARLRSIVRLRDEGELLLLSNAELSEQEGSFSKPSARRFLHWAEIHKFTTSEPLLLVLYRAYRIICP